MIIEWFERYGAPPTYITLISLRNGLPSRERTAYFGQDQASAILVPVAAEPLRELEFPSTEDGMVSLRA
ncbi:unnamed protein product [Peronospora effusa]|nr:unnamed protein product [Peronospora effusa]